MRIACAARAWTRRVIFITPRRLTDRARTLTQISLGLDRLGSGAFSLDFAIKSPRTGLYAIGVECDAPRHRPLEKARAREIWRSKVLSKAVPRVHRASSYAWTHSGEAERSRLRSAVENALRS